MVEQMGFPYAYYQFPETGQQPPFICWYTDGIDDMYADNENYQRIVQLVIEYYSDEKDFSGEDDIEEVLATYELTYEKDEAYLDDQRMHETIYGMEVLING